MFEKKFQKGLFCPSPLNRGAAVKLERLIVIINQRFTHTFLKGP